MKQIVSPAIILSRTDFGEADRIVTLLTPDQGKLRLMAKGVRRVKSKLAGGIELFSISTITFVKGRGDIGTLVSARLDKHFANIIKDINRTMFGYDIIKLLNKTTEDEPGPEYYDLLQSALAALNNEKISQEIIALWFPLQLLRLSGHSPNLHTDASGQKLDESKTYHFDPNAMAFTPHENAQFNAHHIKFLRLAISSHPPTVLAQVQGSTQLAVTLNPLIVFLQKTYL